MPRPTEPSLTRYRVEGVRPSDLSMVWAEAAVLIAPALARGLDHTTLGAVRKSLEDEQAMLWLVRDVPRGTLAAALVSYVQNNALTVWLMGGRDMADWAPDVSPLLARYAQENDLERVEAYTRPGMVRLLRPLGWRHHQSIVTLEC